MFRYIDIFGNECSVSNGWQNAEKWLNVLKACGCGNSQRRLIVSRSSLTNALEKIYEGTVEVEKIHRAASDKITVDYLGLQKPLPPTLPSPDPSRPILSDWCPAGSPGEGKRKWAIKREVWLTIKGKRLIHATTVLLPVFTRYSSILASNLPLGRALSSQNIRFRKQSIEINILTDKWINKGFGIPKYYPLFARRYKLIGMDGGKAKPTDKSFAVVIEVFSPELADAVNGYARPPRPFKGGLGGQHKRHYLTMKNSAGVPAGVPARRAGRAGRHGSGGVLQ